MPVGVLLDHVLGEVLDLALVVSLDLESDIHCILVRSWSSNFFISDAIVSAIICFTDCSRVTVIDSSAGGSVRLFVLGGVIGVFMSSRVSILWVWVGSSESWVFG